MRDVVRIEKRVQTQDANGEESTTWNLVCERYAENLPYPGREVWSGKERHGRVPTVFKMRYPKDFVVVPQMRLTCKGRLYDIISAIDVEGRETDLLLSCDELIGEPT